MRKYTIEEVKYFFKDNGYDLLENEYNGIFTNMKCVDNDGYLYHKSLKTILDKRNSTNYTHKFSIKNPFFWENIHHYIDNCVTEGTIILSQKKDYTGTDGVVTFLCGKCKLPFKTTWHNFIGNKYKNCPDCYKETFAELEYIQNRRNSFRLYEEKAKEQNLKIIDSKISNYKDKITLEDENGYKGKMSVSQFMHQSLFERFSVRNPYTIENMRNFAKINQGNCIVLDQEFKSDKAMMQFVCSCGNRYTTSLTHFVNDKKFRCNECQVRQSNIAKKIQRWLEDNNIEFIKEKTFIDCIGDSGRKLPFDFYLLKYNSCIEVDGIQHYKIITFGASKEKATARYEKIKKYDKLKTDYCNENSISLLRIPFWRIENSEEYIEDLNQYVLSIKSNDLDK